MYGTKIRMIRSHRGFSQEDVAKKLGITQNAYSKIENNHVKISEALLQQLADVFGVSTADIKSPEPVIINFHNSAQNNGSITGEVVNHTNEKLLEQLTHQLAEKDKQIEHLLNLLGKK